jgi:predicted Zn-dependent protease
VTDVSVSEGRVQVDSAGKTLFVLPGERWSSAQDEHPVRAEPGQAASAAGDGSSTSPANRVSPHAVRHVARPSDPASSQASQSTLAEENRVFQGALQRARGGDPEGALDDLDTLAREHPGSPLAQNARVERFRVLHAAGKSAAAAREARRYLSDYPDGFARAEAKRIALSASATKD